MGSLLGGMVRGVGEEAKRAHRPDGQKRFTNGSVLALVVAGTIGWGGEEDSDSSGDAPIRWDGTRREVPREPTVGRGDPGEKNAGIVDQARYAVSDVL